MNLSVFSLAYLSRATDALVDEATLADILSVSQRHNIATGLTGVLAYFDGHFIQVLEGPSVPLTLTLDRIRADPRHEDLRIVGPTPVGERSFPDWCMVRLPDEPGLRPTFSLLIDQWDALAPQAAGLLSKALEEH